MFLENDSHHFEWPDFSKFLWKSRNQGRNDDVGQVEYEWVEVNLEISNVSDWILVFEDLYAVETAKEILQDLVQV